MVQRFASLPHAGHLVLPCSMGVQGDWSNGMASDLAPADGARSSCGSALKKKRSRSASVPKRTRKGVTHDLPLRSLISSSQASTSHHGSTTMHLLSSVGTTSFQSVTSLTRDQYCSLARLNILSCMTSRKAATFLPMSARGRGFLSPLSRRTERVCCFLRSLGPISRRRGTP